MPTPPSTIQLSGPQLRNVRLAFESAFDVFTFPRFLKERLDRDVYTNGAPLLGDFSTMIEGVVRRANQEGWVVEVLVKAREAVPGNQELALVAEQGGLSATRRQVLEEIIKKTNTFLDIRTLITKLTVLEYQVCRVEVPTDQGDTIYGTGFLIAPDLLMTNYHVIEAVEKGEQGKATEQGYSAKATNMQCRFDYKRMNGSVVNQGTVYKPAASWKYDVSHYDPPSPENLDYAVVRLEGTPGSLPIGADAGKFGATRGFIKVPKVEYPFTKGSPLWILQHPAASPLQLAVDTNGVGQLSEDGSRVTYTTNTEGGSSGAPCFNQQLEPVALHHSGDPSYPHVGRVNEGIPLTAVRKLLQRRGLDGGLG
jgi:V8-like Glu-specific endopeptidase